MKSQYSYGSITASTAGDLFWVEAELETLAVCNVHLLSRSGAVPSGAAAQPHHGNTESALCPLHPNARKGNEGGASS